MKKTLLKINFYNQNIFWQTCVIFFIQAGSTTAYAVFYSGLSIYLTQNKFFSHESAAGLTSIFLALNYSLPLIGGFIANKIISYKKFYLIGTLLSFSGCVLLAYTDYLYMSLALFLAGSLSNICLNMFLTQLFEPHQKNERRIAFVWNYIGMNLGFMCGFFLTGFSTLSNNYFYLFISIGFLIFLSFEEAGGSYILNNSFASITAAK